MQPVTIRIASTAFVEGKPQHTRQEYQGLLALKNGKYYAIYHEDAQSGLEGTKTTLKWDQENVLIIRSGAVEHRQEFARNHVDKSTYHTPYLEIPLVTETRQLEVSSKDHSHRIALEYLLYHGEDSYGKMKLNIEIEEIEEDKKIGH